MSDHLPPFHRPYKAFDLPTKTPRRISVDATPDECADIAATLDLKDVKSLKVKAKITPAGEGVWRVHGDVMAKVVQSCVVTLAPVKANLNERFDRIFSRFAEEDTAIDIDIDYDEDDPPEPLGEGIDLGAIAIEALSLGLEPYPRAPGAAFETVRATPPGAEPLSPEAAKPFAGLASLKKAMEGGD